MRRPDFHADIPTVTHASAPTSAHPGQYRQHPRCWGAATPGGSSHLRVLLLRHDRHSHGRLGKSNGIPAFAACMLPLNTFYTHKTSSAFIPGLWQYISPNLVGRRIEQSLCY